MFGTTTFGGASNKGTVFEIANGTNTIITLDSFNGINGAYPAAGVTLDPTGDLFGTTPLGSGTVYEVPYVVRTITPIASFNSATGTNPQGTLVMDSSGNLFGTTRSGGTGQDGTVFEIPSGSNTLTPIIAFTGTDGADPYAGLTIDSRGNLWGTTYQGGFSNYGIIFEIGHGTTTLGIAFNFTSASTGFPTSVITFDAFGDLFVATTGGLGNVFELARQYYAFEP